MEAEQYFPCASLCSRRWWSKDTLAVVTGGNRGIGFALVKRLAASGVNVVLTARDTAKGEAALESLKGLAAHVHFLLLDVSDPLSITSFASSFRAKFGPTLDILVNNAGVSFNELDQNSVEHAETVINTNFYGPKLLIQALLPLFRSSSTPRVLNVSSRLGSLHKMRNVEMKAILEREDLTEEQIEQMVRLFLKDVRDGTWQSKGWPLYWTEYAVSKLALNAYSRVLAKRHSREGVSKLALNAYSRVLAKRHSREGRGRLSVNCFCPGFTQTSMTKGKGTHSADHAASLAATLALLPPHHLPTGKFFLLGKITTLNIASKL